MPRCEAVDDESGRQCYRTDLGYSHRDGWHEAFAADSTQRGDLPWSASLALDLQREKIRWPLVDNGQEVFAADSSVFGYCARCNEGLHPGQSVSMMDDGDVRHAGCVDNGHEGDD